jgi:predicted PurR-regulated permease PerM
MLFIVSVIVFGTLIGFFYYLGPRLASESADLYHRLHQQFSHFQQEYGNTPWGQTLFENLSPSKAVQGHIANYAGVVASSTLGGIVTAFVMVVTALYFAISPSLYIHGTVLLFPKRHRAHANRVMLEVGRTLQWWSLGQLIDMTVVGVLTGVGLAVLGIPLAFALAVLAGLFTFVPYFGAIMAAVPAMLVALTVSWQASLWTLVIFLACHTIEGYLVSPLVQRWTVHLPPALSILAMTILGTLFGPLGVILGTPVSAALLVIVRDAYVGGVLGDPEAVDIDRAARQSLEPGTNLDAVSGNG